MAIIKLIRISLINIIFIALLTSFYSCTQDKTNPSLAIFTDGVVLQNEYVDHYLLSTKYKPDNMPTEENLKEIVFNKAMEKVAVKEALLMEIDNDSLYQHIVAMNMRKMLYQHYVQSEMVNSVITDSLVNKFYNEYTPQHQVKYIMRPFIKSSSKEFIDSQQEKINEAYGLLKKGGKFEEVVKEFSQDIATNKKGGDIGWIIRESLGDAVLRAVIDTLPKFSYSTPFRGYGGFYIMYKGDQRDVPVPEFTGIRQRIVKSLSHSRRHLVDDKIDNRFNYLSSKYNFRSDEDRIQYIYEIAGAVKGESENKTLQFKNLTPKDKNKIIAEYDNGFIRLNELFADSKKSPINIVEFKNRFNNIAKRHIFSKHAIELHLIEEPVLKNNLEKMRVSLLRAILHKRLVKEKALEMIASDKENGKVEINKKRNEYEKQLQKSFENEMVEKYKFEFIGDNIKTALAYAAEKKVEQNIKQQKN